MLEGGKSDDPEGGEATDGTGDDSRDFNADSPGFNPVLTPFQAKVAVVAACRAAIKGNNVQSLFKIIKLGEA